MTQTLFLTAFEGKDLNVLDTAARLAKTQGASLLILHVLEWSPYTFLTPEELAERHKMREAELKGAREQVLEPALARVRAAGVAATGELRHGRPVEVICSLARETGATMIFAGRSTSISERLFGGVASGLIQCASVPVVIVP